MPDRAARPEQRPPLHELAHVLDQDPVNLTVQRGHPSLNVVCARTPLVTDRLAAAGAGEMDALRAGQQEIQPAALDDRGRIGSVKVDAEMPGKRVVARVRGDSRVPMVDGDQVKFCAHLAHGAQTAGGRAASTTEQVGYGEAACHDGVGARMACVSGWCMRTSLLTRVGRSDWEETVQDPPCR